jgi:hypothetical protein
MQFELNFISLFDSLWPLYIIHNISKKCGIHSQLRLQTINFIFI